MWLTIHMEGCPPIYSMCACAWGGGGVFRLIVGFQPLTHGHSTDCKLDSVVYAGVCMVILQYVGLCH